MPPPTLAASKLLDMVTCQIRKYSNPTLVHQAFKAHSKRDQVNPLIHHFSTHNVQFKPNGQPNPIRPKAQI